MPKREKARGAARPGQDGPLDAESTQEAWSQLRGERGPEQGLLYLGGPVDYDPGDHEKAWQHWEDWALTGLYPYCPRCECTGLTDEQIYEKNRKALMEAKLAVFDLTSHSVGTPIELYMRVWRRQKPSILVGKEGVFLRLSRDLYGAHLVETQHEALLEALRRAGWDR